MAGKILIIDGVATNRILFKSKLAQACYVPLTAADGANGVALAKTAQPDLVLLDMALPDMTGIDVLQSLRGMAETRDLPVMMLSSGRDDEARLSALRAGADDFLEKPIDDQTLLARIRNLMRANDGMRGLSGRGAALQALGLAEAAAVFDGPGTIALVSDRIETSLKLRRDLQTSLRDRIIAMTREEALAEDGSTPIPDVFVIDAELGGSGAGLRLMSELHSRSSTRHAAICIMQRHPSDTTAAFAYDLGAADLVTANMPPVEVASRLKNLLRRKRSADGMRLTVQDGLRLAVIDPLTGLYNRRYALPKLHEMAAYCAARGCAFAVMVIDLDRFKSVNDRWGHKVGDLVLTRVAQKLSDSLGENDLLARIGGEEFLLALPDVDLQTARARAEHLCLSVQEMPMALPDGETLHATISIGLAMAAAGTHGQKDLIDQVIDRADHALLAAKTSGRNRVRICRLQSRAPKPGLAINKPSLVLSTPGQDIFQPVRKAVTGLG